jgi:hypothetical protein
MRRFRGFLRWVFAATCGIALAGDPPARISTAGLGPLALDLHGGDLDGITAFAPAGDVDGDGRADILLRFSLRDGVGNDRVVLLYGLPFVEGPVDPFAPDARLTLLFTQQSALETNPDERGVTGLAGGRDVTGETVGRMCS